MDNCQNTGTENNEITEGRRITKEYELKEVEDTQCGLAGCYPKWLQLFASKKSYTIVLITLGLYEAMVYSYTIGTISTIEKRFKLPSTLTGLSSSAWDLGTICGSLGIAFFGSNCNRPKWISNGIYLMTSACFLRYLLHLIYGPGEFHAINLSDNITTVNELCQSNSYMEEHCTVNLESLVAVIILTLSNFLFGIGMAPYYSLCYTYLDDNVLKSKFPFIQAVTDSFYFFGPALGFLLSSYNLSKFIDPNLTPNFNENDPRWIGGWYRGWIPFGFVGIAIGFLMGLFPKILPREAERRRTTHKRNDTSTSSSFKDFKKAVIRLAKNSIYLLITARGIFYSLAIYGFVLFRQKYIETLFRRTASEANLIAGGISLFISSSGTALAGLIISRYKPNARIIAMWSVITSIIEAITYLIFTYLGCSQDDLFGNLNADGTWNIFAECNSGCNCSPTISYSPVCSMDESTTYFSPCHAGCTITTMLNGTKVFDECSCVRGVTMATDGPCPSQCYSIFLIFLILFCLSEFIGATGREGYFIIFIRSVHPDEKSTSIAINFIVICGLALMPGSIIYGVILDSACLIWGGTCGDTGNCFLYDGKKVRILQNLTSAAFQFIAIIFSVSVFFKVGKLKLYDENEETRVDEDGVKELLKQ